MSQIAEEKGISMERIMESIETAIAAAYKKDYGNENWDESSVYIFAPRIQTGLINLIYTVTRGLSLGLNSFSDKVGLTRWIKRRWKNRLQGNTN